MKEEWNERAEKNPYHYISAFREEWDDDSFFKWGEIQTQVVIDRFLEDQNFDPSEKNLLEIGCGAGRMTRALASRFKNIYAFDISERYIQIAKEKNRHLKNINFIVNDGTSFPEIKNDSIDFVFSGWTMRHMPTKKIVVDNIKEISRILKKNGLYKIDPPIKTLTRLVKSKLIWLAPRLIATILGKDKLKLSSTWVGASFTENELFKILSNNGLSVQTLVEPDGLEHFQGKSVMKKWFYGKKIE